MDQFEFYPCLVDDAPASIYVNLRFEHAATAGSTRYTIAIALREAGEHGIGTAEESAELDVIEQAIIARAAELAIAYVGRVRTRGIWETVLYGPDGYLEALRTVTRDRVGTRRFDARREHDPAWRYYRELLLPDAERRQWMDDRRLVQILSEQGDRLATPRRVDHRLAFPTSHARTAFIGTAAAQGFALDSTSESDDELSHRVRVHRVDPIELDHIHDVVMVLVDAAARQHGRYERWEAGIISG
jgi:hypothetical protein